MNPPLCALSLPHAPTHTEISRYGGWSCPEPPQLRPCVPVTVRCLVSSGRQLILPPWGLALSGEYGAGWHLNAAAELGAVLPAGPSGCASWELPPWSTTRLLPVHTAMPPAQVHQAGGGGMTPVSFQL